MKAIVLGITLALVSTSALAWKGVRTAPVHHKPTTHTTTSHMSWKGVHPSPSYNQPTHTFTYGNTAPTYHQSPLMSMDVMPHAGIQICSTPIAYSDDRRCNGFRVGPHCLAAVHRADLDLMPPPPPPAVVPDPVPLAPVKPENG